MLTTLSRRVTKLLALAQDKPLPAATPREAELVDELRAEFRTIPLRKPDLSAPESERTWLEFLARLHQHVATGDPREFLRWRVVLETMFVSHDAYLRGELAYLRRRPDWQTRWRPAIQESPVGHPFPYGLYAKSSGNLIHHAHHVAKFEEKTGRRIDEMRLIVEFGGGYGSMARLAHNLGFRGRYVIFDFPEFVAIQRFYLRSLGIENVVSVADVDALDVASEGPRLLIATWSVSETPRHVRDAFLSRTDGFDAFLIAYAARFGEMDNVAYFRDWRARHDLAWHESPTIGSNYYLFGARPRPSA